MRRGAALQFCPARARGTKPSRLPAVFGNADAARQQRTTACIANAQTLQRSEQDVINVLEVTLPEFPVDRSAIFLTGHSMGSGGAWYLGAKYAGYWKAIAPMSGPFVEQATYPWNRIRDMPIFMTEGTGAKPSLAGSRAMREWMKAQGFRVEYMEVDADHGGMVPLVLPAVFGLFDRQRKTTRETTSSRSLRRATAGPGIARSRDRGTSWRLSCRPSAAN